MRRTAPCRLRLSVFGAAVLVALSACAVRAETPEAFRIPPVRPPDLPYSPDAAGYFDVSARAEPVKVQSGKAISFTLIVKGSDDNYRLPPQRIDLSQLPNIAENFYIDDPHRDTHDEAGRTWQFVYLLKPKRPDVTEIPAVPFVFYNPTLRPEIKGFSTIYSDEIKIEVTAAPKVAPPPREVAALFLETQTGSALLSRRGSWTLPSLPVLVVLLLVPPLLCGCWYMVWRRLNPNAARQAEQRRSRAANQALKALEHLPRGPTEVRAAHVAATVTLYLQQRLDLPPQEPTPAEAADHLRGAGCPDPLTKQVETLYRDCDALRFCPAAPATDLPAAARQFILNLEAHTWSPSVQS